MKERNEKTKERKMNFITKIVQQMKRTVPVPELLLLKNKEKKILGRWNMEYNFKKMNHKIDLSNEDHCGPCGQYLLHTKTNMNRIVQQPPSKTNEKN
jgi:hypothetical protein